MHVLFNQEVVLEYDRNKPIPLIQLEYLDNIDVRLDAAILNGKNTVIPADQLEKAQFVANLMVNSLLIDDFNQAIAMCTYLGNRIKNLKQIVCVGQDDDKGINIEFIYDRTLKQRQQEQTIKFFDPIKYRQY